MIPGYVRYGLSTVDSMFNVFLSDIDGGNIVDEFKDELVKIREDKTLWYQPITFYIATGIVGFMSVEQVIVYVYAGIPYILSSISSIDGSDQYDGHFTNNGEKLIGRLYDMNNSFVYGIGKVDDHTNIMKYANKYIATTPLMNDYDIDSSVGCSIISNNNLKSNGVIFVPGGHRYDVYAVDNTVSLAIRPNRDYKSNPTMDLDMQSDGRREVLLRGGIPEIVQIGCLTSLNGCLFNVWIPNDSGYYSRAVDILNRSELPLDVFNLDDDDLIDSYAMFAVRATELDASNDLDEDSESAENV